MSLTLKCFFGLLVSMLLCPLSLPNPIVPAMYVFGDSIVDGGNNHAANLPPFEVDLDPSLPHRFTNGFTIADYFATYLGLPLVVPINNSVESENSTTGVNFAYGGASILPETMLTPEWTFDDQIAKFKSKVYNLTRVFNKEDFINHLQKFIYLISFAINDYVLYINENNGKAHFNIEPRVFAKYLLGSLADKLTRLYRLGARKFVVNNIWPLGCMPNYNNNTEACNDRINDLVRPYNEGLGLTLHELASDLEGFKFTYSDDFSFFQYLYYNTNLTGITNTLGKCWDQRTGRLCESRDNYVYFDPVHPTQAANREFASHCFKGTLCSPQNIMDLVGQ